ncbi:MAG: ribosome silencing factor [Kiritimatiellae bacterium]|nr:ribosome silencing factor [Kiritimatiellia bacterium]
MTPRKPAAAKPAAKKTAAPKKTAAKKSAAAKKPETKKATTKKPAAAPAKPRPPRHPPLLRAIAKAIEDKKGTDVAILDVRGLSGVADYLVLCTGLNLPHLAALADNVVTSLRKLSPPVVPHRRAGARETEWVVLDYIDVVVHFFTPAMRDYYALEQLWKDAPRLLAPPAP